jgi:hypothetical protein
MVDQTHAYFLLTGVDLNPEEITAKLGITPTKTFLKGDRVHPKGTRTHAVSGWKLGSKLDESAYLEDHINSVLEQLQVNWQVVNELCRRYTPSINCVMYHHYEPDGDPGTGMHFDKAILDQIHQLNAEIDFDLYVLPDNASSMPSPKKLTLQA